jgi:hypothetical protein
MRAISKSELNSRLRYERIVLVLKGTLSKRLEMSPEWAAGYVARLTRDDVTGVYDDGGLLELPIFTEFWDGTVTQLPVKPVEVEEVAPVDAVVPVRVPLSGTADAASGADFLKLRLAPELKTELEHAATLCGLSVSALVRVILSGYVRDLKKEVPA